MRLSADQAMAELWEIRCKTFGLRDFDRGRYSLDRIEEAHRLGERFGELSPEFGRFEHSGEKLSERRDYVQYALPLKAGSHLCEIFDLRLFETPGSASTVNHSDLRMLSRPWCKKQLDVLGHDASPELRDWLERRAAMGDGDTDHQRKGFDRYTVRFCWWSFIRELAGCEAHRNRMGPDVLDHWLIVEEFRKLSNGGSDFDPTSCVKPVRGETKEDRSRLRVRQEAGIQAIACKIVVELLEQVIAIEERELRLQNMACPAGADMKPATPRGANNDNSPEEARLLAIAQKKCQPSEVKAWLAQQYAIQRNGEFKNLPPTFDWLKEHFESFAEDVPEDLRGYKLPSLETWCRQVTAVRKATDTNVNAPRAGRSHGPSIVKVGEI